MSYVYIATMRIITFLYTCVICIKVYKYKLFDRHLETLVTRSRKGPIRLQIDGVSAQNIIHICGRMAGKLKSYNRAGARESKIAVHSNRSVVRLDATLKQNL